DSLGIPKWKQLIDKIDTRLGYASGGAPESYRAEQLFQCYKMQVEQELGWPSGERLNAAIASGWREVVAGCLYEKFRGKNGKLIQTSYERKVKSHPYLSRLGRLARDAQLVVTHNFDDALEVAIDCDPSVTAPPNRRYYSFWKPEPFLRRG